MLVTKTAKVRHELLKVLVEKDRGTPPGDLIAGSIHFNQICELLPRYDRSFLLDNLDFLQDDKFIHCSMEFDNSTFHILSRGNHAFNEKTFLRDGLKDQMNYLYDIVKNISVIALLIIGIWSFVNNITQTRKNSNLIDKQEQRIRALEDSLVSLKKK
jgi:hypothetical protein